MGAAKVVSLTVRPFQAAHLCFEVGGILGEAPALLGAPVAAFDFAAFYAILGSMPTIAGHPARLLYDFPEIQALVNPFTLAALRAEPAKAALSKAVNLRANAFYAKYANAPAIITRINNLYSPSITGSKPNRLDILSSLSLDQMNQLKGAYTSDSRTGVIKTTSSLLDSTLISSGTSNETGQNNDEGAAIASTGHLDLPTLAAGGGVLATGVTDGSESIQQGTSSQNTSSRSVAAESQTIINTDYGYRIPYLENLAQFERAQISLIDEQFAEFMAGQNLPYLAAVFANELSAIDSDIYRLQMAYSNTVLMSPIPGTVTGIYKSPGDAVRAGEAVMRVENNADILLVAALVYRGPIAIGATFTVKTALFDLAGPQTTITGPVVAVRGTSDDDHWEVIVNCNNLDGGGNPIFPLGYHFDYDDTTVSIT